MTTKSYIEILPEDRVKLSTDQNNLIELALAKQLPVDDAEFLEKIQSEKKDASETYSKILEQFSRKYGRDFGKIYLAAIISVEKYKAVIQEIEQKRAKERIRLKNQN